MCGASDWGTRAYVREQVWGRGERARGRGDKVHPMPCSELRARQPNAQNQVRSPRHVEPAAPHVQKHTGAGLRRCDGGRGRSLLRFCRRWRRLTRFAQLEDRPTVTVPFSPLFFPAGRVELEQSSATYTVVVPAVQVSLGDALSDLTSKAFEKLFSLDLYSSLNLILA